MRTFLSPDGESGFAIKPDGDLVSVFSTKEAPPGRGAQMTLLATQEGARKLDAFDTFLQRENEVGVAYLFGIEGPLTGYTFVYKTPGVILTRQFEFVIENLDLP